MSVYLRLTNKINGLFRLLHNKFNRKKLQNRTPCLLASNCTGAFILHDLALRFDSPFVNLYLTPSDFIRYLSRISHYQQQPLKFVKNSGKPYPVGQLDDLTIHFMHYESEADAEQKWQTRSARMNAENMFVMMTERDGCTYQDLLDFEQLPFRHKVVFTHKPYPKLACAFYVKGFENQGFVGDLYLYSGLNGKRFYDQFDYVAWLNQGNKAQN